MNTKADRKYAISKKDFLSKQEYFNVLKNIKKIKIIENEEETVTLIFTDEVYNEYPSLRSFIDSLIDAELIENKDKFVEVMCLVKNSSDNTILDKKYKFSISFLDRCKCEEKINSNEVIEKLIANNKIEKLESKFIVFSAQTLKQTQELEKLIKNFFFQSSTNIDSASNTKFDSSVTDDDNLINFDNLSLNELNSDVYNCEAPPSYDEACNNGNNKIVNHSIVYGSVSGNVDLMNHFWSDSKNWSLSSSKNSEPSASNSNPSKRSLNGPIINNGEPINIMITEDNSHQQIVISSNTIGNSKNKLSTSKSQTKNFKFL